VHKFAKKTEVFPISCHDLDLEDILEGFPASIKSFPCQYLGLPLHLKRLQKIDFMPLLGKVGGNLSGWKGKLMTKAARAQLDKSVLTVVVTYNATVFPLFKWLIKKIDKPRRNFFWKCEDVEGNKGGMCLVKWDMFVGPRSLGALVSMI
jgi:hypothetical protein